MKIAFVDIVIIAVYLLIILAVGIWRTRAAGTNLESFFLKNRTTLWPMAGISMAAANFSIDTPLAITSFIYQQGICGIWLYWSSAISGIIAAFVFAKLWRRSAVVTDAEITELRYSGKSASFLRLFKGLYFGVLLNVFVLGWVFLAFMKICSVVTGLNSTVVLLVSLVTVFVYVSSSGFFGVVNTSVVQYTVALLGAVLLAVFSVIHVGGFGAFTGYWKTHPEVGHFTDFFPDFAQVSGDTTVTFLTCILLVWWSQKYSDGGGKYIQRILSTKDERHAVWATLLYSVLSYAIQIWPWIITALCAVILFPQAQDPEISYVHMLTQSLPTGIYGLVLASLIAAFMSTVDTHLNLGASYIINDMYRRFIFKDGSDRHYVWMSRLTILILLLLSILLSVNMQSVAWAWVFLLTFVSGAGLTWILRWFWWRVNAWSEISALIVSSVVSLFLEIFYTDLQYSYKLFVIVPISTAAWVLVTFLTSPSDDATLVEFVKRTRPAAFGWKRIYEKYDIAPEPVTMPVLLLCGLGIVFVFATCFGIGSVLFQSFTQGIVLLLLAGVLLYIMIRRLRKI